MIKNVEFQLVPYTATETCLRGIWSATTPSYIDYVGNVIHQTPSKLCEHHQMNKYLTFDPNLDRYCCKSIPDSADIAQDKIRNIQEQLYSWDTLCRSKTLPTLNRMSAMLATIRDPLKIHPVYVQH